MEMEFQWEDDEVVRSVFVDEVEEGQEEGRYKDGAGMEWMPSGGWNMDCRAGPEI
jgi:hypothetical protein